MLEIVFDFKYLKLQDMKALRKKFIYYYSLKYHIFAKATSTKVTEIILKSIHVAKFYYSSRKCFRNIADDFHISKAAAIKNIEDFVICTKSTHWWATLHQKVFGAKFSYTINLACP